MVTIEGITVAGCRRAQVAVGDSSKASVTGCTLNKGGHAGVFVYRGSSVALKSTCISRCREWHAAHASRVARHMLYDPWHMSHVTCHMSHVTCHMSHITYHMSHVTHTHCCCSTLTLNKRTRRRRGAGIRSLLTCDV